MIRIPRQEDTRFAYAIGRIRALETRLLDRQRVERLLEAETPSELLELLQDTDYGQHIPQLSSPFEFEKMLKAERKRVVELVSELSPEPKLTYEIKLPYDFHNVKVLLKAKLTESNFDYALYDTGNIDIQYLKKIFESEDYRKLPSYLQETVEDAIEKFYMTDKNPRVLSYTVDKKAAKISAQSESSLFLKYYRRTEIDLINLKTLVRIKSLERDELKTDVFFDGGTIETEELNRAAGEPLDAIPHLFFSTPYHRILEDGVAYYKQTGTFTRLEKLFDDFLVGLLKLTRYIDLGPEPLVAYFFGKLNEMKILRMLFVGKINRISKEKIRERLPDVF